MVYRVIYEYTGVVQGLCRVMQIFRCHIGNNGEDK